MYRNLILSSVVVASHAFGTTSNTAPPTAQEPPEFGGGSSKLAEAGGEGLAGLCTPSPKVTDAEGNVLYGFQTRCLEQAYAPPSTWTAQVGEDEGFVYDLAIVGAGVQASYLVNELLKKKPDAKIAVFERSGHTGGRLMSAYGSGSLGLAVHDDSKSTPPPEYGGMRLDPNGHWLVWDAVQEVVEDQFPGTKCGRKGPTKVAPVDPNLESQYSEKDRTFGTEGDCDDYMVQMTTATMRYSADESADVKTFGEYLLSSRFDDDGTVLNECLSMIGYTQKYIDANMPKEDQEKNTLDEAVNIACKGCAKVSQEMCDTCAKFPSPGKNLVSCIGYDDLTQVPVASSIVDASVVTGQGNYNCQPSQGSTENCANLYLFKYGSQSFAQNLMKRNKAAGPIYGKNLMEVLVDGEDVAALAAKQASTVAGASDNLPSETPTKNGRVRLVFDDNSVAVAKAVYMTMLPLNLIEVKGMDAWTKPMIEGMLPFGATKLFINWEGGMPEAISKATKNGAIRLVTDGNRPGQMARQIFYWDDETILVYQTAPMDDTLPANVMQEYMQNKGMDETIAAVMKQLEGAFKTDLAMPSWARVKAWGNGALSYYKPNCGTLGSTSAAFQSRIQRPLGQSVPVFYGSSEISAGDGGYQGVGWIMGSFMMVQLHLNAIVEFLNE